MKYTIFIFSFIISLGLNAQLKIEKNKSSVCITDLLNTTTVCKDASDFYVFEKDARIWIINNDVQSDLASGTNSIRLIGKRPLLIDDIMWTSSVPSVTKPTSIKNAVKLLSSTYFTDAKDTSVVYTKPLNLSNAYIGNAQQTHALIDNEEEIDCPNCLRIIIQNNHASVNAQIILGASVLMVGYAGNSQGYPTSYVFDAIWDESKNKYASIQTINLDATNSSLVVTQVMLP